MEPTPKVGHYIHNPNYDIKLKELTSDKEIGLILCNNLGVSDRRGMQEGYMPRTAMQIANNANPYDDLEMPYTVEVQSSMIGGRGIDDLVKDKTRYADGFRMDTSGVYPICGPEILEQVGHKSTDLLYNDFKYPNFWATMDPNMTDPSLIDTYNELLINEERTFNGLSIYLKSWQTSVKIWYDVWSSEEEITHLRYSTTIEIVPNQGTWFNLPIPTTIVQANKKVRWYFQPEGIAVPGGFTGRIFVLPAKAIGANVWAYDAFGSGIWAVYWADTVVASGLSYENNADHKFFEYKNALYMVKRSLNKAGCSIWRNGYRGLAKPNTANKNYLKTNYTNLTPHSLIGCVARISNGPGELENQNWRVIQDNTATDILVSPPWNITHTAETEYVILGTNIWNQVASWVTELSSKTITDILPLEDYVLFAFGDDANLGVYKEANFSGTWGGAWVWNNVDTDRFDFLSIAQDNEGKLQIWGANANSCKVSFAEPVEFYKLYMGSEYFVFDIWKEEREKLQTTIDRLTTDIAASVNSEHLRLTRLKEDALEEYDDIENTIIPRLQEDYNYELNHSPELLRLTRMQADADDEYNDLIDLIAQLTSQIAATSDPDTKRSLERMKAEKEDQRDAALTSYNRITEDITELTENHNSELIRLQRMIDDENEKLADLNVTIDRLTIDIENVVDADKLVLERQLEDAIEERDKLLTYIHAGDTSSHITNMIIYGAPGIPYILKETEVGSIYENVYSKIPIGEIASVRSEINGRAAMAYGVYLYFNLEGGWIERYYDQQMNDVSPNQNEGLPVERQGEISKLQAYAGRWYAAINAGYTGVSSVLLNNELGWHEIYRSPISGMPITDIYVQAIPGIANADQMWISEGTNILAIPISISPLKQKNYSYFGTNAKTEDKIPFIETAWVDFNYKDVDKYFHTLKLFVDMPNYNKRTGFEYQCKVWFKTDNTGLNNWYYLGSRYANNEIMEFPIVLDNIRKVHGRQIKFKISMQSNIPYRTPRLKAWVCDAVIRFEVKKSWNLTFQLQPDTDLNGVKILMDPNEIYSSLEKWANSAEYPIPLMMSTNDINNDNKLVFIDPATVHRKSVSLSTNKQGAKKDFINIGTAVVYEV